MCVFDAVFEKSFLEPLELIFERFFMVRILWIWVFRHWGVMKHIEIKEYNMLRALVKQVLRWSPQWALEALWAR